MKRSAASHSDEWSTPPGLFAWASARYGPFLLDVCASKVNHLCEKYFTKGDNALTYPWKGRCWCNPPYSRGNKPAFLGKARERVLGGLSDLVTLLVPHDSAEKYWSDIVEAPAGRLLHVGKELADMGTVIQTRWENLIVEKVEIRGRVNFIHNGRQLSGARHASVFVTFARPNVLRPLVQASALRRAA